MLSLARAAALDKCSRDVGLPKDHLEQRTSLSFLIYFYNDSKKMHIINFPFSLFLSVPFNGIKCILIFGQPSPPSTARTFSFSQTEILSPLTTNSAFPLRQPLESSARFSVPKTWLLQGPLVSVITQHIS